MIFGPVFFASIGLQTSFNDFNLSMLWFSIALVAVALLTKVIGCGGTAKLCKFNMPDSLKIGVGMMNRGEVGLIVAKKGLDTGLIHRSFLLLLLFSSSFHRLQHLFFSRWFTRNGRVKKMRRQTTVLKSLPKTKSILLRKLSVQPTTSQKIISKIKAKTNNLIQ